MLRLTDLKSARSLRDVADLLECRPSVLSYILYKQPISTKYEVFVVPKRSGGQRTIKAPCPALKHLQQNLSVLLQDCVDELAVDKKRNTRAAHGFVRERSIITNAREHRHRRWILNLDLEDFFPTINFGRIRGFLIKNRDFELAPKVATVIAQLACFEGSLPQGSPCSPVFANLVAHILDMRLVKLARETGCTYSRYADDITFSTNKEGFPPEIAQQAGDSASSHEWLPGNRLREIIERSGFHINGKKTRVMYRTSRQEVTGLVVNQKLSVPSDYRRNVRAMVDRLTKSGTFEIWAAVPKDGVQAIEKRPGSLNELHGMLGFIHSIDIYDRKIHPRKPKTDNPLDQFTSEEKTYRKFLFYKTFYAATSPIIVSEGETDNIYLTHAIRSLANELSLLAEIMPNGKIGIIPRLYKYHRSSTAQLMELSGGGYGVLTKFIGNFSKNISNFGGPIPAHPVIVLYDNDDAAKSVISTIKTVTKSRNINNDKPFVHVIGNLYAVPTPGAGSKIEDFFDPATRGHKIDGKSFSDTDNFDTDKYYGKMIFAKGIVKPKADELDFSGFRPLLNNIEAVIQDYAARVFQSRC